MTNESFDSTKTQAIQDTIVQSLGWVINQKDCEISTLKGICNMNAEKITDLQERLSAEADAEQHWRARCGRYSEEVEDLVDDLQQKETEISILTSKIAELEEKLSAKSKTARAKSNKKNAK